MHQFVRFLVLPSLLLTFLSAATAAASAPEDASDREKIMAHIHSIFRAYIDKDLDTIRRTHTADWTGFRYDSQVLERGIDDYMQEVEAIIQQTRLVDYEFTDIEIQLYQEIAIVYYTARTWYSDEVKSGARVEGRSLRSVDIYRRENGGWNQCGSHIVYLPSAQ